MKNYKPKNCEICGKLYIPNSSTQKYCSQECRKVIKRLQSKRYYQKNKEKHMKASNRWKENNKEHMNKYYREYRRRHLQNTVDALFNAYSDYLKENVK